MALFTRILLNSFKQKILFCGNKLKKSSFYYRKTAKCISLASGRLSHLFCVLIIFATKELFSQKHCLVNVDAPVSRSFTGKSHVSLASLACGRTCIRGLSDIPGKFVRLIVFPSAFLVMLATIFPVSIMFFSFS